MNQMAYDVILTEETTISGKTDAGANELKKVCACLGEFNPACPVHGVG